MKRKVKTHEEARRSHKALQARRDALVKMRRGEIVEIRLAKDAGGAVVTARALAKDEWPDQYIVLAIVERRLRAGRVTAKKQGSDLRFEHGGRRLHPPKGILGVVLTINGESPYVGDDWYNTALRREIDAGTQRLQEPAPISR